MIMEIWWRNPKCKGKLPPGSMGFPLIGETLSFFVTSNSIDMHPFVNERLKRYGPLFKTNIAGRPVAVSSDPEFNYFVLQQEGKLIELYYMDSFSQTVHNDNLSNLGGYFQRYLRRSILRHFGHEPLKRKLLSELEDVINHEVHKWTNLPEVDVKLQTVPKKRKAIKLTTWVLEERMKGYSYDNSAEGCNKKGDFLDEVIGDIGKEAFLTKEFVPYLLFGLLLATVETISPTVTLATMYLLDNPSALQQLTEEHEEILKNREDANSGLVWEEYKSMTFTRYVRKCSSWDAEEGYTIPKGWVLLVMPTALHLNPNIYEDPLTFNPSRWKNIGSNGMAKNFIPFGGGNRPCAGAEFSKVLVAVFLHVWVTKFFTKVKGGNIVRAPILGFPDGFYVNVSRKHC
ncbi:hypothetical protein GOBAR_DD23386 [Gossypium barbadense]|nr:hypothetical protein GOBAR_DD23386 [Gossypium barbadense]